MGGPDLRANVVEACRRLALGHLAQARSACERLVAGADGEALHDFRVALRRLRSCLDAYRPWLKDSARRPERQKIRDFAASTNPHRDREVQIAWLSGLEAKAERPIDREAVAGLIESLGRDLPTGAQLAEGFAPFADRLDRRLRSYRTVLPEGPQPPTVSLARAMAERLGGLAAELRDLLASIRSLADDPIIHRARIRAKRLRYLLEPARSATEAAVEAVATLTALQDLLGELHDIAVFTEQVLPTLQAPEQVPARQVLANALWQRRVGSFRRLEHEWLHGAADPFVARLERLRHELSRHGETTEVERKFLLTGMPAIPRGATVSEIEQGYIPGSVLHERVRRLLDDQGEHFFRTVKLGTGLSRLEIEEETTADIFDALWNLTIGRRVMKLRYAVPAGELVWEVDRFTDRDLVLAEVELPDEETAVTPPDWLAPSVVREVTGEDEFVNLNLAK